MPGGTLVSLSRGNARPPDSPARALVPARIAATARAHPRATAIVDQRSRLDYASLWSRVDGLAWHLRDALCLGAEDRVAVAATRSASAIVSVLGILRAGCAFVPFEPTDPAARLRGMFTAAGVRAVVGPSEAIAGVAPEMPHLDPAALPVESSRAPSGIPRLAGRMLAYVIFTSGSTGGPKAVGVEHGALAGLVTWSQAHFQVTPSDAFLQFARLTFDASIWEIFTPLSCGATLVLPTPAEVISPPALERLMRRHAVTHADIPAAVWETMRLDRLPRLRFCMTGGEAVAARTVRHCAAPGRLVVNGYGPTEATDLTIVGICEPGSPHPPPIGLPVPGTTAYVVDDHLSLAGPGEVGELYLGGAQLARGYLGRPGLTAERFVPDPWGGRPGRRLYRTGDLVRRRPDGVMEFVGRRDRQVKVRGVRIELGEVELHVNACDGILEAAVTAHPHDGGRRLVAHVAGAVDLKAIRQQLEARVPRHLVPSTFVLYESLPRTPNGKIDYPGLRSMPEPPGVPGPAGRGATAPVDPLAEAVHEILGVWPAARDALLDLGADSLDAMRIVARLRAAGVHVDSRALLTTPLPELRLAGLPRVAATGTAAAPLPPDDGPVPLTPAQAGIWYQQLLTPTSTAYLVPVRLELEGPLEPHRLRQAWAEVVSRHDALRSRLAVSGGRAFLELDSAPPPLAVHDLGGADEAERDARAERILARAASEPFPLTAEAPFRLTLVRMSRHRHVLGLTAHHLLCDGWSLAILVRDLGAAYHAAATDAPETPPEQPAGAFATYARRHAAEVAAGRYDTGVRFWKGLLPEPPAPWPTGGRATGVPVGRIFTVGEQLTGRLRASCRRWRVTSFVALLAGFAAALAALSGRPRVVVGAVSANRPDRALEEVVGHFVNTLPLPIAVGAGRDRGELIASVDRVVRVSSPHWEVPLPLIAAALPRAGQGADSSTGGPWNAVFEFDSMPPGRFEAKEVTGQLSDEGLQQGAISALSLRVVERRGRLRCVLVADAAVMTGEELAGVEQAVLRAWRWLAG